MLGIEVCLGADMAFRVPAAKKAKICAGIDVLLAEAEQGRASSVRALASTIGRIMATHVAVGDAVRRMTRFGYNFVARITGVPPDATRRALKVAWDRTAVIPPEVLDELRFWRRVLPGHAGSEIRPPKAVASLVFASDASDTAWCGFMDAGTGQRLVARDELREGEAELSSTARELLGSFRTLQSFEAGLEDALRGAPETLAGRQVIVYSDNQSAVRILETGSKRPELQRIARRIFDLALRHSIDLTPRWRRRNHLYLQFCDDGSKLGDCDFALEMREVRRAERMWSLRFDIDRFASDVNKRCPAFMSRMFCPGTCGVDCYAYDWSAPLRHGGEAPVNWVHPPRAQVARALRHLRVCRAGGVVVVPYDRTRPWWPFVKASACGVVRGADGRPHWRVLRRRRGLLRRRGSVPLPPGYRDLVLVHLDFRDEESASAAPVPSLRSTVEGLLLRRSKLLLGGGVAELDGSAAAAPSGRSVPSSGRRPRLSALHRAGSVSSASRSGGAVGGDPGLSSSQRGDRGGATAPGRLGARAFGAAQVVGGQHRVDAVGAGAGAPADALRGCRARHRDSGLRAGGQIRDQRPAHGSPRGGPPPRPDQPAVIDRGRAPVARVAR